MHGGEQICRTRSVKLLTDQGELSTICSPLPHGELMIAILAGLATFERHLIRARTDEGRKRAQAKRVQFGRKPKLSRYHSAEALARREAGETSTDIGRSYGVSHSTIPRL